MNRLATLTALAIAATPSASLAQPYGRCYWIPFEGSPPIQLNFCGRARPAQPAEESAPIAGPSRAPRRGQGCECPYDLDAAGNQCGERSAYSRPGGQKPNCYS